MATLEHPPRTPGRSPPPEALPSITEHSNGTQPQQPPRRTSLGFLRRSKSTEPLGGERKVSGSRSLKKKDAREEEMRRQREAAAVPQQPPQLPDLSPAPQLNTFGGENARYDPQSSPTSRQQKPYGASNHMNAPPVPPMPKSPPYDPYARTESMTNRGRYSYASSAVSTLNSPRRMRRRKDPTPYNVLVVGARNSGKTSFINFLRTSLAMPAKKRGLQSPEQPVSRPQTAQTHSDFTSHYLETEIDGERVGITLWDSQGLEPNIVDLQLRDMSSFLESKFEDTFAEERKVVRAPGVRDTHIHCVFFILDPSRLDENIIIAQKALSNGIAGGKISSTGVVGGLHEGLDLQVLRTLQGKTTVVPIISKADTVTTAHMAFLKRTVWDSLKQAKLDPLEALGFEDEDTDSAEGFIDRFDETEEDNDDSSRIANIETTPKRKGGAQPPDADAVPLSNDGSRRASIANRRSSHRRVPSSSSNPINTSSEVPYIPLSILSPDPHSMNPADGPIGRKFAWGFADPYNPDHCDFVKLKEAVFSEWRGELREASREVWYERWRTSRLKRNGVGASRNGSQQPHGRPTRGAPAVGTAF